MTGKHGKLVPIAATAALGVGALAAAGVGALAWGAVIERNRFVLREETIPVLPSGAQPIKVLHISDLHMAPGQGLKTKWVQSLATLEPDLVINTGDNLGHSGGLEPLLEALAPVMQFPGVFVPGSNDYFAPTMKNPLTYMLRPSKHSEQSPPKPLPTGALHTAFGNAGWVSLSNRHQSMAVNGTRLDFSGVDDPHIGRDKFTGFPHGAITQDASAHLRIGVTHAPYRRVLDEFTRDGAGLIVAGHTHGGQVCLPGGLALTTNSDLPVTMARGVHQWKVAGRESWLEVSAGLGTSFYAPIRFFCPPEAALLTLVPRR